MHPPLACLICLISLQTFDYLSGEEHVATTQEALWEGHSESLTGVSLTSSWNATMPPMHFENVSRLHEEGNSVEPPHEEQDDASEPEYKFAADKVGLLPKGVYLFFIYFISIVGLFGNIFVFLLTQHGSMKFYSYSIYLRFLAVADSVYLITTATEDILDHQFRILNSTIYSSGEFVCQAWTYIKSVNHLLSPWLITALTLDRYVAIIFPFRLKQFNTTKTALLVCLLLVLVTGLEALVFSFTTKYDEDQVDGEFCYGESSPALDTYYKVRLLCLESTLPCTLILYFNTHVIWGIKKRSKFRQFARANESSKSDNRVTLSLVAMSLMAFCTLLPIAVLEVLEALWIRDIENLLEKPWNETDVSEYLQLQDNLASVDDNWPLLNLIKLMNFGQNFYVMMVTGQKYRHVFVAMMYSCYLRRRADKSYGTNSHDQTRKTEISRISSASN